MRCIRPFLCLAGCLFGLAGRTAAHDIPSDIKVDLLVKPAGRQLQVLVRVPLKAVRDVDFPERAGGYLDVDRLAPLLPDAARLWIGEALQVQEDGTHLPAPSIAATQISLESDRSFASFETARAHVIGPKPSGDWNLVWDQVFLDALLEYPIQSPSARFSMRPGFEGLAAHVVTVLRFITPSGAIRAYEFTGDPGVVPLDPGWSQAALRFVKLGFLHILDGTDHLLFLLCLVIPLRRLRPLLLVVTAFTAAHSLTLAGSAFGIAPDALWFPPLIELLIAASIVYMALENIVGANPRHRWIVAFGFGLVHGFGFSFALRETLQFAGSHLLTSLLSFNIGVELGQLMVLIVLIPSLRLLFRFVVAERMGTIIVSAFVAHTAWHWMLDRGAILRRFEWPDVDAGSIASAMRWLVAILLLAGLLHAGSRVLRKRGAAPDAPSDGEPQPD